MLQSETLLEAIESCIEEYQKIIGNKKKNKIPQANDIDKIREIPFLVSQGVDTDYKLAKHFQFSKRQGSYYREATQILGLINTNGICYHLTESGEKYVHLPIEIQKKFFVKLILDFPVIHMLFSNLKADENKSFTLRDIVKILNVNSSLTGKTLTRRANTISRWLKWIQYNIKSV